MKPYYEADGITLYHGDCLRVLETLPHSLADALITDPPYSSGGMFRSDRAANPIAKYVQHGTEVQRPSFSGDNRDGRSWATWCTIWLSECLRVVKPTGYALMFTDWRQLPLATDAFQWGGFVWRGLISWDKTEAARAPHTGYFRHQCEYVVWGTNGATQQAPGRGPWAGAIRAGVLQRDKFHITGKPTSVTRHLLQCVAPGGLVIDPFAGSGTTLVAAADTGRRAIGIEAEERYCEIAARRLEAGNIVEMPKAA